MGVEFEILDAVPPPPHRIGGRKGGAHEREVADTLAENGDIEYSVARARKEAWTAKKVELDYRIQKNEYVLRAEVRQVCATAFSSLTQTLRSIPDLLERREGLDPLIAEKVSEVIDTVLDDIANEFEMLGGGNE